MFANVPLQHPLAAPQARCPLAARFCLPSRARLLPILCGGVQGNRELIDSMAGGSAKVLTQVLKLIDNHDLYGSVAYPKRHTQKDISDIYRLSLATHGVFTNVALQEPFGLTVIEVTHPQPASSSIFHAPVVSTTTSLHFLPSMFLFLLLSEFFAFPPLHPALPPAVRPPSSSFLRPSFAFRTPCLVLPSQKLPSSRLPFPVRLSASSPICASS